MGRVARRKRGSEFPAVSKVLGTNLTLVNATVVSNCEGNQSVRVAAHEVFVIVQILIQFLRLDRVRDLGGIDADARTRQCRTSSVGRRGDVVLGRVVVLLRLWCRRRVLDVIMLLPLLTRGRRVWSRRSRLMSIIGNVVQLRALWVHVWLLKPGLLLMAVLLSILLRRRRLLAEPRSECWVLLVMRRLRLTPLLSRVGLGREGRVDGVARPWGHARCQERGVSRRNQC